MPEPDRPFDAAGYAAAALALLVLASQNSLARWAVLNGLTAADLVAIRFCLPGLVWLPDFLGRLRQEGRPALLRGLAFAATAGVPYGLLLTSGYRGGSATHGSVIVPSATLTGGVLLSALVARQPVGRAAMLAVATALAGMALVSGFWREAGPTSLASDLLFLSAGLVWAFHILAVGVTKARPREVISAVMSLSLLYLPAYLATAELPGELMAGRGPRWQVLAGAAAFLTVLHSSIALPLYAWATARLTPLRMSLLTPSVPVIGVAVAALTLGERPAANEWAGGALVLAALAIAARARVRRDKPV